MANSTVPVWKKMIPIKCFAFGGLCCAGLLLGGCNATETTIDSSDLTLTFQPAAGTYGAPQRVKISAKSQDVYVNYSISSSKYSSSSSSARRGNVTIAIDSGTKVIRAYASYSDHVGIPILATYTVQTANAPVFGLSSGTYIGTQSVTLTSSTSGSKIYYTTDGSSPTTSSLLYTAPIQVSSSETIKAIAVADNYGSSALSSATYTINTTITPPIFSLSSGTYGGTVVNVITSSTSGAKVYYTTDGTMPTVSSSLYAEPILIDTDEVVKAVAAENGILSSVSIANYYYVAAPSFNLASGKYLSAETLLINALSDGEKVYYTMDGTSPTAASLPYVNAIQITSSATVKSIAVRNGVASSVSTGNYVISIGGSVDAPTFSPSGGAYSGALLINLVCPIIGAKIYYTTNGMSPITNGTLYNGFCVLNSTKTLQAVAVVDGKYSSISVAKYVIY